MRRCSGHLPLFALFALLSGAAYYALQQSPPENVALSFRAAGLLPYAAAANHVRSRPSPAATAEGARAAQLRAALGLLSCSCKGVGPAGGFCLQSPEGIGGRFEGGAIAGGGVGGSASLSPGLAAALAELTAGLGVHNFGAGLGNYDLYWDAARAAGKPAPSRSAACDGAENIEAVAPLDSAGQPRVKFCDLTEPMNMEPEDWVVSLEVGAYIPRELEGAFVENVQRHAKIGVVLSWALPEQAGDHRVNLHDAAAVTTLFPANAWVYDEATSRHLRKATVWFANTIYVFRRVGALPPAPSTAAVAVGARVAQLRAALIALSCSCRGIGPTGGFCLQPPEIGGRYEAGALVGGSASLSPGLAAALAELTAGLGVHNFGAGLGNYDLYWDAARAAGKPAPSRSAACDGAENIEAVAPLDSAGQPRVKFCDLTEPMNMEPEDWVVSLEVGAYIPRELEGAFVENVQRHAKIGVVLSWALPEQAGDHRVNHHDAAAVTALFPANAWVYDEATSRHLRKAGSAKATPWPANTIYVFLRTTALPPAFIPATAGAMRALPLPPALFFRKLSLFVGVLSRNSPEGAEERAAFRATSLLTLTLAAPMLSGWQVAHRFFVTVPPPGAALQALKAEAARFQDLVLLADEIVEEPPRADKRTLSQRVHHIFRWAVRERATWVLKTDTGAFVHFPRLLAELENAPRVRFGWGRLGGPPGDKKHYSGFQSSRLPAAAHPYFSGTTPPFYLAGMGYLLSTDLLVDAAGREFNDMLDCEYLEDICTGLRLIPYKPDYRPDARFCEGCWNCCPEEPLLEHHLDVTQMYEHGYASIKTALGIPLAPLSSPKLPQGYLNASECCPSNSLHVSFVVTTPELMKRAFRVLEDLAQLSTGGAPVVVHLLSSPTCLDVPLFFTVGADGSPYPAAYTYTDAELALATPAVDRLCKEFENANKACLYLIKPFLYALLPTAVESVLVLDVDLRVLPDSSLQEVLGSSYLSQLRRSGAVLALARELQPTYLLVGMMQGFNGGVQVLDLKGQRESALYTEFLSGFSFSLPEYWRFHQRLDLGDQTLYSILNETHPEAVAELRCGWNFNLCQYFRTFGNPAVPWGPEASLAGCSGNVTVVHGNGKEYERLGLQDMETGALRAMARAMQRGEAV